MNSPPKDFFISYRSTYAQYAEWIAWVLEDAGYRVDLDRWDLPPGGNIVSYIHSALQRASQVLALISTDYFTSGWTEAEWTAALASGIKEGRNRLILVKIEPCQMDGILTPYRFVDLYKYRDEEAKRILLEAVQASRRKPSHPPLSRGLSSNPPAFPGYYPSVWNVPDPNLFFVGRQSEIDAIYQGLHSTGHAAVTAAHGIVGLGGVGKTQLALEYAYRYRGEYDVVWWVDAEGGFPAIKIKLFELAAALGLPHESTIDFPSVFHMVKQWLRTNTRWLLIYDNVSDPNEVQDLIVGQYSGHILLTSRYAQWGDTSRRVEIDVFQRNDAVEFLCKRTGLTDKEGAIQLSEQLGCLPLALEQAGAYIAQMGLSFPEYSALYSAYGVRAFEHGSHQESYPGSVRPTWAISFNQINRISQQSISILHCLSFLAADDVPVSLFAEHPEAFPADLQSRLTNVLELNGLIKPLRDYSLLKRSNRNLRVHRLVQAVVRDESTPELREYWSAVAVRILDAAFPASGDDVPDWPAAGKLVSHILAATTFAERENVALQETASVLNRLGVYQTQIAAFAAGEVSLRKALDISNKANGEESDKTGLIINNLGQHYHARHRLRDAQNLYARALAIMVKHLGPEHSFVATILNNLGSVAYDLGLYGFAAQLHERALRIQKLQLGGHHQDVSTTLNNMGLLYQKTGNYDQAEGALQQALTIDEAEFGRDHPRVATTLNNLGLLCNILGDYERAATFFKEALAIRLNHLTTQHPHVCQTKHNLGAAYVFTGRHEEAPRSPQ